MIMLDPKGAERKEENACRGNEPPNKAFHHDKQTSKSSRT